MLSETVSKALQLCGGAEAEETARFVSMFDKFFDSLNVSNHRKVFQQPYRSAEDFRLKVRVPVLMLRYIYIPLLNLLLTLVVGDGVSAVFERVGEICEEPEGN